MLRVVSVSLGSARRDFDARVEVGGRLFHVQRVGANGDAALAARWMRELDGRVDALGLGGVNMALAAGGRRYPLALGRQLAAQAPRTPVVDGCAWKGVVEPLAVARLVRGGFPLPGATVVVASVLDRYPLARALAAHGCRVLAGDAYFALGLPILFPSLRAFEAAALLTAPVLTRLPLPWLYPLGRSQDRAPAGAEPLLTRVGVLAGDFHLLRRRLPHDLGKKAVLASTVTDEDMRLLRERGAAAVATLNPSLGGRAPGANVWEAMAVAAAGKVSEAMTREDYVSLWEAAGAASTALVPGG